MAEDGSRLWLRYEPLGALAARYQSISGQVVVEGDSATSKIIRDELSIGLIGMLGNRGAADQKGIAAGAIVAGTPQNSAAIRALGWEAELQSTGAEGVVVRHARIANQPVIAIASQSDVGALYGAFALLRWIQTAQPIERLNLVEKPRVKLRMLNHWDNLNGTIERGYAGRSIWQWDELPEKLSQRYTDYARANASVGINGTVLNNVNANVQFLSTNYLYKVKALAEVFRPYGIRVYLSANFAAPRQLGNLESADPLEPRVAEWWKTKVDEIYRLIPDFGGLLVKANSEGQPGPQDYGRTHAEGANVLADALSPHNGIVMWRAFVYNETVDADRIKRAYLEFMALEGKFKPNVIVQVKNGPLDFMPREPFSPLFGAAIKTPLMAELQVTQEYLGQSKHAVFLGTMWKEFLDADTYAKGAGSTVGKIVEGTVQPQTLTGMAGVANTGMDVNWCGHDLSQANWYAYGRLAWDHTIPAEHLAEEWTRMTFSNDSQVVETIRGVLMSSREAFVNYTMPLGLHHLIGGDHYAPMPWNDRAQRADWTATYYHRADANGVGFDRTRKGSNAVEQYFPPLRDIYDDPARCPENLLLWFHHVRWDHKLKSGQTLWKELCDTYTRGVEQAKAMQAAWAGLVGKIDPDRHKAVSDKLAIQVEDAAKWRTQILEYFQRFSGMQIG